MQSLYTLCCSQVKKMYQWNTNDLDHILREGDNLFKSLGAFNLLLADDLPRSVVMSNCKILLLFLELKN